MSRSGIPLPTVGSRRSPVSSFTHLSKRWDIVKVNSEGLVMERFERQSYRRGLAAATLLAATIAIGCNKSNTANAPASAPASAPPSQTVATTAPAPVAPVGTPATAPGVAPVPAPVAPAPAAPVASPATAAPVGSHVATAPQ